MRSNRSIIDSASRASRGSARAVCASKTRLVLIVALVCAGVLFAGALGIQRALATPTPFVHLYDPQGDAYPADLIDVAFCRDGANLWVALKFPGPVQPVTLFPDSSRRILIFFDADRNATTGHAWPLVPSVGVDYTLFLGRVSGSNEFYVDGFRTPSEDSNTWVRIPVTGGMYQSGDLFLLQIPLGSLGWPTGLNFFALAGGSIYDQVPDYGHGTYSVPEDTTTTTSPPSTTTTTTAPQGQAFSDVSSAHPYFTQIADLATRSIVNGFPDGTFRPDSAVTRQQFAKMIVKSLGFTVTGNETCPFSDVGSGMDLTDPFYPSKYVAVCANHGITTGFEDHTFRPYNNITRQQLITMVVRAANLPEPSAIYVPLFSPDQFYPQEHYLNARKASYAGLLDGLQGLGPYYGFMSPATRAEVCVLLYNLLHR